MTTINFGKIRFDFKGAHSTSSAYLKNDCVTSGGNLYVALADVTGGNPATDSANWKLMLKGFNFKGVFDGSSYQPGDCVTSGGGLYVALSPTVTRPTSSNSSWQLLFNTLSFLGTIDTSRTYYLNEVVTDSTGLWRALIDGAKASDGLPSASWALMVANSGVVPPTSAGNEGDVLVKSGGSIIFAGNSQPTAVVSSNTTTATGKHYVVSAKRLTLTLPDSPAPGNFIDVSAAFTDGSVPMTVIDPVGNKIDGVADKLTIDTPETSIRLVFIDSNTGWKVL